MLRVNKSSLGRVKFRGMCSHIGRVVDKRGPDGSSSTVVSTDEVTDFFSIHTKIVYEMSTKLPPFIRSHKLIFQKITPFAYCRLVQKYVVFSYDTDIRRPGSHLNKLTIFAQNM